MRDSKVVGAWSKGIGEGQEIYSDLSPFIGNFGGGRFDVAQERGNSRYCRLLACQYCPVGGSVVLAPKYKAKVLGSHRMQPIVC